MGYYTGNGVVTGGSNSKRLFGTLLYNGGQHVYQTSVVSVNTKRGVSLTTCTNAKGKATSSKATFSDTGDYPWMGINGKSVNYSHRQIGDSNLYELTETTETLTGTIKGDTIQ